MRLSSYVLSFCLHLAAFLLIWFWPASPLIKLDAPPVLISLVDGAPGGNRTPSPIQGQMGSPGEGPLAPTPPAPKAEIAAPEQQAIKEPAPRVAQPRQENTPKPPEPIKPELKPEPKEDATPIAEKKEKIEPPKPKEDKQPEPPKEKPKPTPKDQKDSKDQKGKDDPVAAALAQVKRNASSRADSGDRGNAVEQALAQAKRKAGGNRGGGGGEGDGPGGGGLGNLYMGQVMLAVRPNWGFATPGRANLRCVVKVRVDMEGAVLQAQILQGSGNAQYDSSAVNAVVRTGQAGLFPPPPSPEYTELDLVFTFDELMGR